MNPTSSNNTPVLGFAAFSGTGKTTLLTQLVPILKANGLHLGLIKHAHHNFDVEQPGKDSYVLRHAGAERVLIGSRRRWALMVETLDQDEPRLQDLLDQFPADDLDLILVEGFKHEYFPKIELHRASLGKPLLHPGDDSIIACASDTPHSMAATTRPQLDINQPDEIARFILQWLQDPRAQSRSDRQASG